ncbi:MAG: hypothetical protein RLY78_521 [Pseudomonadota bacterium]|jgi:hypothetical protein|uniref:DUF4124 domain-containing protein n=1 Tax=Pseudaquabacterium rugosum TaxID=2984194 RepID=A0ABU9BES0_9BURK
MLLRRIAIGGALILLSIVIHTLGRQLPWRDWLQPAHTVRRPLVFDNGSVRDGLRASEGARLRPAPQAAAGALRKCVRGERVTYSNLGCPDGHQERAVAADRVNVIESGTRAPGAAPAGGGSAQASLRQAVDLPRDERLRQRMVEQAVEGERPR